MFTFTIKHAAAAVGAAALIAAGAVAPAVASRHTDDGGRPPASATTTPIKHVVVIFQENVSFDHYFATYPNAANLSGETRFTAAADTPTINGLNEPLQAPNNPNSVQPFRLTPSQAQTCDQDHTYTDEQKAFDSGLMDKFVETVGRGAGTCVDYGKGAGLVMGYYDGNTVTGLWNYAQHFAMSDNSYGTTFGPSTVGALNLASGQTHGFATTSSAVTANTTVVGDPQPAGDICDSRDATTSTDVKNKNVGDLLNAKNVSWGWFQGGFRDCAATSTTTVGTPVTSKSYIPHHEPFQYFASTANLQHTPPASVAEVGHNGPANHQYDLTDFWSAVNAKSMPAVSFLKAPAAQDGHAGYSNPIDEQAFVVDTINKLQKTQDWKSTAVILAYDDSDGWYDHQMSPIVNQSDDPGVDALAGGTNCGTNPANILGGYLDRCGYGPRLPLLVISPYAKSNFVDHTTTDQTSILRFIEDNWSTGRIGNASFDQKAGTLNNMFSFSGHGNGHGDDDGDHGGQNGSRTLFLDPKTGQPVRG
ncbi:phospholipase C [Leifsonia sp. 2MCAF36]|uniref:phospholipase C n=1 Tax=Leifsonia sp. 2MCAF36 TaxID=3232988 RepID=UPI003F96D60D